MELIICIFGFIIFCAAIGIFIGNSLKKTNKELADKLDRFNPSDVVEDNDSDKEIYEKLRIAMTKVPKKRGRPRKNTF